MRQPILAKKKGKSKGPTMEKNKTKAAKKKKKQNAAPLGVPSI
jgi:hypothetical protein